MTFSGHLLHPLTSTSIWILSNKATSLSPFIKYYCKWYSASSLECKCVWSLGFYRHDPSCLLPPERFSKFLLQTRSVSVLLNCRMFSQKDPENENKRRRAVQTVVEEGQLNCAFALFLKSEKVRWAGCEVFWKRKFLLEGFNFLNVQRQSSCVRWGWFINGDLLRSLIKPFDVGQNLWIFLQFALSQLF